MKWCDRRLVTNPLMVGLCLSEKKFKKEMKRLGMKTSPRFLNHGSNATTHFFVKDGEECAIVALGSTKGYTDIEVDTLLVHEAVHVWQAIKDNIGEHKPSMEFEAYSIQQISMNLMVAYRELR